MEISEKIKAILGEELADDMTAEQILEKLNGKNVVDLAKGDYTSKAKYEAEVKAKEDAKKALADYQKSQMSAEEKAAEEIAEKMREKDELTQQLTAELNKTKAEKVFAEAGISEEQYANLVSGVDVDTAKLIVEMVKARENDARQSAKEEALKNFKSPPAGNTVPDKKLEDMSLDELQKLRAENPTEYDKLYRK